MSWNVTKPRTRVRLYLPLMMVVALQAALLVFAPSKTPSVLSSSPSLVQSVAGSADGPAAATDPGATAPSGVLPDGTPSGPSGTSPGASPTATTAASGDAPVAGDDTSHCTPDGRQYALLYHAPPCRPKWKAGADNGGATYPGVTESTVKVAVVMRKGNPTVDALMSSQNLSATDEEVRSFNAAAQEFINKHYELHGRRLELVTIRSGCENAPPDIPCFREEAKRFAAEYFIVMQAASVSAPYEFYQEAARLGLITVGGLGIWPAEDFAAMRPFRYDIWSDGTTLADLTADYYCKKLATKPASHSGRVIHPSIGSRDQTERRLGILSFDDPASRRNAKHLQAAVSACSGGAKVSVFTYAYDTARLQEQATPIVQGLIADKITTVTAPPAAVAAFFTRESTRQGYFPEWLLGLNPPDLDLMGRLQDQAQWDHSFGLTIDIVPTPTAQWDSSKVWNAAGREGAIANPLIEAIWQYNALAATLIQMAGPVLTPQSVEAGTIASGYTRGGWLESKGRADVRQWRLGGGDYTAYQDAREIYWSKSSTSDQDGKVGAYLSVAGGRRYAPGEWPSSFEVPVRGS